MRQLVYLTFVFCAFLGCTAPTHTETEEALSDSSQVPLTGDSTIVEKADFEWNEEGWSSFIPLKLYVDDPDENAPTNVRLSPGGKTAMTLPQSGTYMVTVVAQENEWFRISDIVSFDDEEIDLVEDQYWIHNSVLAASTRNDGNTPVQVYTYPRPIEEYYLTEIKIETAVRVIEIYYKFVHIKATTEEGTVVDGWIEANQLCGNPVTTCP